MTLNDLIVDIALVGDCGSFRKITDLGYDSEEQFLEETEKSKGLKWSRYDDGRKVMTIDDPNGGWICKFVTMDGWLATYDYAEMARRCDEARNNKAKPTNSIYDLYDHFDDDHLHWDDDNPAAEDYGLEDYNEDYGWWR